VAGYGEIRITPGVGCVTFATTDIAFVLLRRQPEVSAPGFLLPDPAWRAL
jgi:hypothetical protein